MLQIDLLDINLVIYYAIVVFILALSAVFMYSKTPGGKI